MIDFNQKETTDLAAYLSIYTAAQYTFGQKHQFFLKK